jgi:hypothetical protein
MKINKYTALFLTPFSMLMSQDEASNGEVFELSPFVVSTEEDSGYYASQTLAGSRLKTNVRDVASSIQILTADFLDDVGATDSNELFLYATSTESAGLGGNFTDYSLPEGGDGTSWGDESVRISPQNAQRIRGLAKADLTRNYFSTIIPSDRFNTDRVEINRGANSILFGLGSPAGINNTGLSQAQYKNFGNIRHRMDSEGSLRLEGDFNVVLAEDKLALRLGLLTDEQKFYQEPAFEDDERIYVNLNAKPWKGATIRAFIEDGKRNANRPSLVSPGYTLDFYFDSLDIARSRIEDQISGLTDINGAPLTIPSDFNLVAFDPFYADTPANWLTKADANGDGNVDALDDYAKVAIARDIVVFPQAKSERLVSHPNVSRHTLIGFNWDQTLPTAGVFPGTNAVETNVNSAKYLPKTPKTKDSYPYHIDPNNNGKFGGYNYMASIQPWREWDQTLIPAGIQNLDVFDFTKHLLSGDAAFQNDDWKHKNIVLEQLFWDNNAGIEIAYDKQEYNAESFVPFQGYSGIFVDLMETYKGQPNPNFGRPFVQGRTNKREVQDERESTRVTAFVNIIPEDLFGENNVTRWLGRQRITGLYNKYKQWDDDARFGRYMDIDPSMNQFGATLQAGESQLTDRNKEFNYMVYLSDQVIPQLASADDIRLNPMTSQDLWGGDHTATIKSFLPDTGELYDLSTTYNVVMNRYRWNTQDVESYAAIWNGYFLNDHLVGLVGWRQDEVTALRYESPIDSTTGVPSLDATPNILGSNINTVDTLSWSVVGHLPDNWLPGNMGLSLHYGVSENFSLEASSQDLFGNKNPAASGETKEYGFTISLADNKFILRANWFETDLINSPVRKNLYSVLVNRGIMHTMGHLLEAEQIGETGNYIDPDTGMEWTDPNTGEPYNPTENYTTAMNALAAYRGIIPEASLQTANLTGVTGDGTHERENLEVGDTEDLSAEGVEIELIWNPTRSWRVALNVARQETVKTNIGPRTLQLMELFDPYLNPVDGLLADQVMFPNYNPTAGNTPEYISSPAREHGDSGTVGAFMDDLFYKEFRLEKNLEGRSSNEQREWRVNLVTNYRFRQGRLKGLSVGGALRWQSGAVIGYPAILVGTGSDGLPLLDYDVDNPHVSPSIENIDAWVRYDRKIFGGKVDWQIELRVLNLNTDADDLIPVAANQTEEYSVAMWRSGSPRIWRITNTFKF